VAKKQNAAVDSLNLVSKNPENLNFEATRRQKLAIFAEVCPAGNFIVAMAREAYDAANKLIPNNGPTKSLEGFCEN